MGTEAHHVQTLHPASRPASAPSAVWHPGIISNPAVLHKFLRITWKYSLQLYHSLPNSAGQEDTFKEAKVLGSAWSVSYKPHTTEWVNCQWIRNIWYSTSFSECALFNNLGNRCFSKQLGFVTKSRTSEIQFEMYCQTHHTLQVQINASLLHPQEIIFQMYLLVMVTQNRVWLRPSFKRHLTSDASVNTA